EQRVDLGQAQRACVAVAWERALDALAVLRDLVPLVARRNERSRRQPDPVNLLLGHLPRPPAPRTPLAGHLPAAGEPEPGRGDRVARGRLAVHTRLAADLSVALPRR